MNTLKKVAVPLCVSVILTGCGGGGGGGSRAPSLQATVSASQTQFEIGRDDVITLTGGSNAEQGSTIHYRWSLDNAPANSVAQPDDDSSASIAFRPDVPGDYRLCLTVRDATRSSGKECAGITATSIVPVAVPGTPSVVLVGQQYQLDGSASQPPTGGNAAYLSYQWTLEEKPEDSQAGLDDATYVMPRFTADLEGTYRLSLVVGYEDVTSATATLTLIASRANGSPVARPGDRQTGRTLNERVYLDGSGSYDPDGDTLQYRWGFGHNPDITVLPPGSQAVLTDADTATPSFVPDMLGTYTLWLQVYDGTSLGYGSMQVVVDQLPAGHVNTPPVAVLTPNWGKTFEIELGDTISPTATYSYDRETEPYAVHNIGKRWRLLSHPSAFDPEQDMVIGQYGTEEAPSLTITFSKPGDYTVELAVFDGELWSDPATQVYTARTGANRPPMAKVSLTGAGNSVGVGQTVSLDGEQSSDPDDNRLSYHWTLVDRPDGSHAVLNNPTSAFPSFVSDVAGPYTVQLIVTDSHGFSSDPTRLRLLAKNRNNAPVARPSMRFNQFDTRQPLVIYPITLPDFSGSDVGFRPWHNAVNLVADAYDPDGDPLSYLWSLLSPGPEHQFVSSAQGSGAHYNPGLCTNGYRLDPQGPYDTLEKLYQAVIGLRNWTCPELNLAPASPGTYRVQLLISDGIDTTGPFNFTIPALARDNYPSLLLEQTVTTSITEQVSHTPQPDYAKQKVFPHDHVQSAGFPVFDSYLEPSQTYLLASYQLTAFDRDYTLTDVQTISAGISAEFGYRIAVQGITDGQTIARGETRQFDVILETPATLLFWNGDAAQRPNLGGGLHLAFAIAEQPGWTFRYTPYIYPVRSN